MKEFRLSALAEADLTDIWDYVAGYDEQVADAQIERLVKRFGMLATFQGAGRDRNELSKGLKSFPVDRYVIFYRVIAEGIEVIRVLHGSRDIEKLFEKKTSPQQEEAPSEGE